MLLYFYFDSLSCNFDGEEYFIKGFIGEEFFRDESLVDVDGGLVEVDESHEEFEYFFYVEPVALIFGVGGFGDIPKIK